MQWDFQADTQSCVFRFRSRPDFANGITLLWPVLIGVLIYLISDGEKVILIEGLVFALAFVAVVLHRMFSHSSLVIKPDAISLDRRLFGMGSCRTFFKSEVESLGYQKEFTGYRSHTDSALMLMVRDDVMPVRFAQTLSPEDAQAVFDKLKQGGSWLSERIRPIGTPLF